MPNAYVANGGAAKRKGRGITHPCSGSEAEAERTSVAKVCTSEARKTAGYPLRCARAEPSARFGFLIRVHSTPIERVGVAGRNETVTKLNRDWKLKK
ncbi:hypothetical protein GCM10022270_34830 [Terriglobus aquaticus]